MRDLSVDSLKYTYKLTEVLENTKIIKWLTEVPINIYIDGNVNSPSILIRYPITTNHILYASVIWSCELYWPRPGHYGEILTQTTILNYDELMIEFQNSLFFTKCFILSYCKIFNISKYVNCCKNKFQMDW